MKIALLIFIFIISISKNTYANAEQLAFSALLANSSYVALQLLLYSFGYEVRCARLDLVAAAVKTISAFNTHCSYTVFQN